MSTTRAPCPQCDRGPRDTALAITNDERGTVAFCHRCGYIESRQAERAGLVTPGSRAVAKSEALEWSTRAQAIWNRTQPLRGTLGETYLRTRGCADAPEDSHVRYLPPNGEFPPALCSCVTDAVSGKPISLHFTYLAADGRGKAGTGLDKRLLPGHRAKGGVIRIWPDDAVSHGLAIAEGIETALAAAHLFAPVWATVCASNMRSFPVLLGVESLTIFADHDDAGVDAAQECGLRWHEAQREARILRPRNAGEDVADIAARSAA